MPEPSNKLLLGARTTYVFVTPVTLTLTSPSPGVSFGPTPLAFTGSYIPALPGTGSFTPSIGFTRVG